jgi:hypothetical protein
MEIVPTEGYLAVYGWPGSTLRVYNGVTLVNDLNMVFPELPLGMSLRAFVALPAAAECVGRRKEASNGGDMPLVNCPECERQISTAAEACPQCGYPMQARTAAAAPAGPKCYACSAAATTRCQSCGALSCALHLDSIFVSHSHELRCTTCCSSARRYDVIGRYVVLVVIICFVIYFCFVFYFFA